MTNPVKLEAVLGAEEGFSVTSKPVEVFEGEFSSFYTLDAHHALGLSFSLTVTVSPLIEDTLENVFVDLTLKTLCCSRELYYYYKDKKCEGCQKSFPNSFKDVCQTFYWKDGKFNFATAVNKFWPAWAQAYEIPPLIAALTTHDVDVSLLPVLRELIPTLPALKNSKAGQACLPGKSTA